jgi:hypothetical protein
MPESVGPIEQNRWHGVTMSRILRLGAGRRRHGNGSDFAQISVKEVQL